MSNCDLYESGACKLERGFAGNLLEIHVTITPINTSDIENFSRACADLRVKPLIINLSNGMPVQPMTCSMVVGTFLDAKRQAELIQVGLKKSGFTVNRIKIEASPQHEMLKSNWSGPICYFECHIKLLLPNADDVGRLAQLCKAHDVHLSRNALKTDELGASERFVTIRRCASSIDVFKVLTNSVADMLRDKGYRILKSVIEVCVYDDNELIDEYESGRNKNRTTSVSVVA